MKRVNHSFTARCPRDTFAGSFRMSRACCHYSLPLGGAVVRPSVIFLFFTNMASDAFYPRADGIRDQSFARDSGLSRIAASNRSVIESEYSFTHVVVVSRASYRQAVAEPQCSPVVGFNFDIPLLQSCWVNSHRFEKDNI